jgi:hypothetical protein
MEGCMGKFAYFESAAINKAQDKLGKGVKMPKPKVDLSKPEAEVLKSLAAFQKGRDELEKKLADVQNACGNLKTAIKQEIAFWGAQKFDGTPDDKSVKEGQKIICDQLTQLGGDVDKAIKSLDDLDSQLEKIDGGDLLSKYR